MSKAHKYKNLVNWQSAALNSNFDIHIAIIYAVNLYNHI
jgi:hypothetical protein